MSVRVFAAAKINLTLQVGRPRADRLHPLQSVVMFADVGDIVEAAPGDGLTLSIRGEFAPDLAADDSNLVLRAARALAQHAGIAEPKAALTLEKNLPVASGIGGGSADAAATLRALNTLWDLQLGVGALDQIARTLGGDVPVCLAGVPAFMTGAGEAHAPIRAPELAAVLVNPMRPLATVDVYRRFDAMALGGAFVESPAPNLDDRAALLRTMTALGNDLEAPARALLPELDAIAARLHAEPNVSAIGLSGSGATMFAIVETHDAAVKFAEQVQSERPDWWVCETTLAGA